MSKLIALGEALIDFTSKEKGYMIKDAPSFIPNVGGAPANVCATFNALGGISYLITKLGNDSFGDKIYEYLNNYNINTNYILRTSEAITRLVFVSIDKTGERDFNFMNSLTSDMLISKEEIKEEWFKDINIFHFCSVNLMTECSKEAHLAGIKYAKNKSAIISFDPNVRLKLWNNKKTLKNTILNFIPFANVLKISSDELEFITDCCDINEALPKLFVGSVELVLYTMGENGSYCFTKNSSAYAKSLEGLKVVDTTGAGDAFIGSFLYCLTKDNIGVNQIKDLSKNTLEKYLSFANFYSGLSVEEKGSIASYRKYDEIKEKLEEFINENI